MLVKSRLLLLALFIQSFLFFTFILEQTSVLESTNTTIEQMGQQVAIKDSIETLLADSEMLSKHIVDNDMLSDIISDIHGKEYRVTATIYHPVRWQTDSTPNITADNSEFLVEHAGKYKWIAISRDMHKRWGGKLDFGDLVLVSGTNKDGIYKVRDTMNPRYTSRIDFLSDKDEPVNKWDNVTIKKIGVGS